jgi:hypothetical protein
MENWGKVGIHVACEMLQKVLMKNFKHPSPSQKTQSKTKQNKTKTKQYHTSTPCRGSNVSFDIGIYVFFLLVVASYCSLA